MLTRLVLFFFLTASVLNSQDAYRINVDIDGYQEDILTLGYYLMDKQYIVDTAFRSESGDFTFSSDSAALEPGIYLVVLAPDNQYFQLLIGNDGDQEFTMRTKMDDLNYMSVTGSEENELFYDYLTFLADRQQESAPLRHMLADSTVSGEESAKAKLEMEALDARVKAHQQSVTYKYPAAFVTAIIEANRPALPPDFSEVSDEEARRNLQWRWLQDHYFDNLDLNDERLLRTPFLFQRVDYYVNTLQIKHPDTLAEAIDRVLENFDPLGEAFKFFLVHYTNEAATSKIVGMDALYVHLVDKYYATGKAYWAEGEQLAKMTDNAERLSPLLIGQRAPDMAMLTRAGQPTKLYDIDAEYTVLYFWRYDCPACKKSTPHMKEFYQKWKDRGVVVFSVCTKGEDELGKCWDYVDEHDIGDWMQVADPYQRYYKDYDIQSTPAVFLLDRDKNIVSKRIGADQLDEVLTALTNEKFAPAEN